MAIRSQAYVLPLILIGARELLPYGSWKVKSGHVKVIFVDPISTRGLTMADRHRLTAALRRIAEKTLQEEKEKKAK